jgi:hypothetical protein
MNEVLKQNKFQIHENIFSQNMIAKKGALNF